jgi:hypothetical protein
MTRRYPPYAVVQAAIIMKQGFISLAALQRIEKGMKA